MESSRIRRQSGSSFERGWRTLAVQSLALLVAVNGALAFYAFRQVEALRAEVNDSLWRSEQRFHSLQSQVRFDSERRRLLLGIRNAILQTRPQVGLAQSYLFANLVLEATEKYPSVDPLLLVSVGIVESGYDLQAISHAGARGLYQIYPSTGRLLARMLGWEYDETLLHDPARNTEMAACYLDLLGTAYNDIEMILAEYNGGPLNAGYFRAKVGSLAGETRDYVPRVIAVYERLGREIGSAVPEGPLRATRLREEPAAELKAVASVTTSSVQRRSAVEE
ncbi:MAG: lytic transglycosylase domain-containing protein [Vicinamibacteria bacterium]